MKKSQLRQIIKEEIEDMFENIGEKHTNEVIDIIDRLNNIKQELGNSKYVGWGVEDIERIINKVTGELNKLPRLINSNTK